MTQVTHRIFNTNLQCSFACLHSCDFFKIWSRARTELLKIRVRNFTAGETPSLHNKCTTQTKSKLLLQLLVPEHCVPWSSGVAIGCAVHAAHRCGGGRGRRTLCWEKWGRRLLESLHTGTLQPCYATAWSRRIRSSSSIPSTSHCWGRRKM